uniref:Uncharacterized protein n=1 Tax=Glossina brevipalpis TaxID=37001 RepID=A0A1A9WAJ7_9MUSC
MDRVIVKKSVLLTVNFLPGSIFDTPFCFTWPLVKRPERISSSTFGPIFSVRFSLARDTSIFNSSGCNNPCLSITPPANIRATTNCLCSSNSTVRPNGCFGMRRKPTILIVSTGIVLFIISGGKR